MNLGSLVVHSDPIFEEYENTDLEWMDWASDFDHGADWKILPVFASKDFAETHYGSAFAWQSTMEMLRGKWPRTLEIVFKHCDPDRVSLIAFSRLRGGNELRPHKHDNKGHLIFHMGVEIPDGDVGILTSSGLHEWNEPRDWLLFDDNHTHCSWNRTSGDRVLLYLDLMF